jgi:hypothetical protein
MNISISIGRPCKAAPAINDNSTQLPSLSPVEAYAVRNLARRSGLSTAHALLVAELSGIVKGVRHG